MLAICPTLFFVWLSKPKSKQVKNELSMNLPRALLRDSQSGCSATGEMHSACPRLAHSSSGEGGPIVRSSSEFVTVESVSQACESPLVCTGKEHLSQGERVKAAL